MLDSNTILAFFNCHGFITPGQIVPLDRAFGATVPLPDTVSLVDRVMAAGSGSPTDDSADLARAIAASLGSPTDDSSDLARAIAASLAPPASSAATDAASSSVPIGEASAGITTTSGAPSAAFSASATTAVTTIAPAQGTTAMPTAADPGAASDGNPTRQAPPAPAMVLRTMLTTPQAQSNQVPLNGSSPGPAATPGSTTSRADAMRAGIREGQSVRVDRVDQSTGTSRPSSLDSNQRFSSSSASPTASSGDAGSRTRRSSSDPEQPRRITARGSPTTLDASSTRRVLFDIALAPPSRRSFDALAARVRALTDRIDSAPPPCLCACSGGKGRGRQCACPGGDAGSCGWQTITSSPNNIRTPASSPAPPPTDRTPRASPTGRIAPGVLDRPQNLLDRLLSREQPPPPSQEQERAPSQSPPPYSPGDFQQDLANFQRRHPDLDDRIFHNRRRIREARRTGTIALVDPVVDEYRALLRTHGWSFVGDPGTGSQPPSRESTPRDRGRYRAPPSGNRDTNRAPSEDPMQDLIDFLEYSPDLDERLGARSVGPPPPVAVVDDFWRLRDAAGSAWEDQPLLSRPPQRTRASRERERTASLPRGPTQAVLRGSSETSSAWIRGRGRGRGRVRDRGPLTVDRFDREMARLRVQIGDLSNLIQDTAPCRCYDDDQRSPGVESPRYRCSRDFDQNRSGFTPTPERGLQDALETWGSGVWRRRDERDRASGLTYSGQRSRLSARSAGSEERPCGRQRSR